MLEPYFPNPTIVPLVDAEGKDEADDEDSVEYRFYAWLQHCADLYLNFGSEAIDAVRLLRRLSQAHTKVYDTFMKYAGDAKTLPEIIDAFIQAYEKGKSLKKEFQELHLDCLTRAGLPFCRRLLEVWSACDVDTLLESFLFDSLSGDQNFSQINKVIALVGYRKDILPKCATTVVIAGQALGALLKTAAELNLGKDSTALTMATVLHDVEKSKAPCPSMFSKKSAQAAAQTVRNHLDSEVTAHLVNLKAHEAVEKFIKEYSPITDAIECWNFTKCPWIYKETSAEQDAIAKLIEGFIKRFPTWQNILVKVVDLIVWENTDKTDELRYLAARFSEFEANRGKVSYLLSQVFLTSVVLSKECSSQDMKEALAHAQKNYEIDIKKLPQQLLNKVYEKVGKKDAQNESTELPCNADKSKSKAAKHKAQPQESETVQAPTKSLLKKLKKVG